MSTSPKILIVEDEALIAKDLSTYLASLNYHIIGIAHDSETALDMVFSQQPDLVLLDINIDGSKVGIEVAKAIQSQYDIPYIFLTSFSDEGTLNRVKDTMPYGYIVKPFDENSLKTTVAIALSNHQKANPDEGITKEKIDQHCNTPLSDKEYEVLMDLCNGHSNSQIAQLHFVSLNTVKFHLKRIYLKLEVSTRSEAVKKVLA